MREEYQQKKYKILGQNGNNALFQIIAACAVGFVLSYAMYIILLVISPNQSIEFNGKTVQVMYENSISPYIAMRPFHAFLKAPWVIITYAWAHSGFFALLSNMLWLYCFGSVIQSLVGYKEIIPLFIATSVIGACIFLAITAIFPELKGSSLLVGALPAIMGFAIAAITLAPKFRFYIGDRFAVPLWLVLAIFVGLNVIIHVGGNYTALTLTLSGGLVGFLYMKLLQNGNKPGQWFYAIGNGIHNIFAPAQHKKSNKVVAFKNNNTLSKKNTTQQDDDRIDAILDKINQKGYSALTKEEKEILLNASQED
jgi:membrane associated rhomboid family serine protease